MLKESFDTSLKETRWEHNFNNGLFGTADSYNKNQWQGARQIWTRNKVHILTSSLCNHLNNSPKVAADSYPWQFLNQGVYSKKCDSLFNQELILKYPTTCVMQEARLSGESGPICPI